MTLARVAAALCRALFRSLRLRGEVEGREDRAIRRYPFGRELFALCERDVLLLSGFLPSARFTVLVANGRDGDLAARGLSALGADVVRGASERGGTRALHELVGRLRRAAGPGAVVVDGPLGPSGEAKPGTVLLGQMTALPVRPVVAAARWQIVFRGAWSRIYLPLPFSRAAVVVGEPIPAVPGDRSSVDERTAELTRRLTAARERALALLSSR